MPKLVMMRHGASVWNELNLFTGWVDIPLSKKGIEEAQEAGKALAAFSFDIAFSSTLIRAIMTALYVIGENHHRNIAEINHSQEKKIDKASQIYSEEARKSVLQVYTAWELNERMYGELQGLNKEETKRRFGEEQVKLWRRSYRESPPGGESLQKTCERTIPYFLSTIVPHLKKNKNVFISAHGNSLRSIVMEIEGMSEEEILHFEIPTGKSLIYEVECGEKMVYTRCDVKTNLA